MSNVWLACRNALSSIASSTACSGSPDEPGGRWGLRAQSLDLLPARDVRLRRQHTARSLEHEVGVATVCGDPVFNGTIVGIVTDEVPRDEDSPLLRKTSLSSKQERARRKAPEASYIEFYKRWRSLENVAEGKAGPRKAPRFAIPSWLLGIFSGREPGAELRRAPPLLDTESAV